MSRTQWVAGYCSVFALSAALAACGAHDDAVETTKTEAVTEAIIMRDGGIVRPPYFSIPEIGGTPLVFSSGRSLRVDRAAATSFARHRQLAAELDAASAALTSPAITTEQLLQTEQSVILLATTKFTVKDPAQLRSGSPLAGKFRMKGPGSLTLARMTPEQRRGFESFKAKMLLEPKTHPLGQAARKSDQALLDAALSGQGDIVVSTEVELPKAKLSAPNGTYRQPAASNGNFNFATTQNQAIPGFGSSWPTFEDEEHGGVEISSGEAVNVTQFVNGFTEADAYEWSERWDFGIAQIRLEVGASYGLGLRIPVKVTSRMDPTRLRQYGGSRDASGSFDTDLAVEVLDADEEFYESAGMSAGDIEDGKELVLNADARIDLEVELLGVTQLNVDDGAEVDFGKDFKPPFGDCGTDCGIDVWVPSAHTRTEIDGAIGGANAQLGFNLAGDGEVVLGYRSLYDGQTAPSRMGNGSTWPTHDVSFTRDRERHFHTELAALETPGTKPYGYELSDVEYTWSLVVTPGIKGNVWVDCLALKWEEEIAPMWFDFAEAELGSVPFRPHAGTRAARSIVRGEKSWSEGVMAGTTGAATSPAAASGASQALP